MCRKYNKKVTCFWAKRKEPTWHLARIEWVNMGMLSVTLSRAEKYRKEKEIRRTLPLEHDLVLASIMKAQSLNINQIVYGN